MNWSKVENKYKKTLRWWYYKILCEVGYNFKGSTSNMYHCNLIKLCNLGFNLYGQKIY